MQLTEKELGLPWKTDGVRCRHLLREGTFEINSDGTSFWIAQTMFGKDAAFIAHAANNHHALLRALKDTLSYASRLADPEDQEWLFYRKQADAALLAAEGEVQP